MLISYRLIIPGDTNQLLGLFTRVRPSIARLSNRFVYKAIIKDSLKSNKVVCFVAVLNNKLVGYVIAVKDWHRFQRIFILRYPVIGLMILAKRLQKFFKVRHRIAIRTRSRSIHSSSIANIKKNYSWEDSANTIAKIIHIGIDETVRSRGIGSGLYAAICTHLGQGGISRIDARIDEGNLASVRLHERTGWTVMKYPNGFFAFIEIRTLGGQNGKTSVNKS